LKFGTDTDRREYSVMHETLHPNGAHSESCDLSGTSQQLRHTLQQYITIRSSLLCNQHRHRLIIIIYSTKNLS